MDKPQYRRVCYLTNRSRFRQSQAQFLPGLIDPFLCTHIIYSFADFAVNGNIFADREDQTEYDMYAQLNSLKNTNPKLKTILTVGGWLEGGSDFSDMVASLTARSQFVQSAIRFLRENGFDGLEISWQFPGSRGGIEGRYLDFATIMTYDLHGSWDTTTGCNSPLYPRSSERAEERELNMDFAAKMWEQKGLPKEKINIGFATYGRSFTLEDSEKFGIGAAAAGPGAPGDLTEEAGFLSYMEICKKRSNPGVNIFYDEEQKCTYVVSDDQWTGFDDLASFATKK
ncbi:chitotriosidase-1 [Patella vulgata]|uniref:chitotriosidase-1 n=1 Tax=Patella vulgata TaxID=6465 RepID=UPI002180197E|nr:chitotriosidase-1 [Patella vulgata]